MLCELEFILINLFFRILFFFGFLMVDDECELIIVVFEESGG